MKSSFIYFLSLITLLSVIPPICESKHIKLNVKKLKNANHKKIQMVSSIPIADFAAAVAIPSSLGFIKREYGVSYGYGGAIAAIGILALKSKISSPLASYHAFLHVIYGIRLCLFLLYREIFIPKFRELREKIEIKSPSSRLARAPFIFQCGMLYAFMSFPLLITHSMQPMLKGSFHQAAYSVCLVAATIGLALQIVGDTHKALAKAKGEGLVTTGLFSIIRHPNYLGELILWSASTAASLVVAGSSSLKFSFNLLLLSLGSILGSLGIAFVLGMATNGLELRQKNTYGETEEYKKWMSNSFGGLIFSPKKI